MNTSISLFCEHCGAANARQASSCCFCGKPLMAPSATDDIGDGCLPTDTVLKGRYRIIKTIHQGSASTIYRALDRELNYRQVALKELTVSGLNPQQEQEAIETFKREAMLLATLQHANLPTVYEHFTEHGRWYMVMSFLSGETLAEYLKRTNSARLPLPEVLQIGKQLCAVLHYLHNQQPPIVFRDVKPANILRTPDGHIYLLDFSMARRFKPGQKRDTITFGSIGYASPEQSGKAQTTPRSDIYSLGATLHELLSSYNPESKPLHLPPLQTLDLTFPKQLTTLIELMLEADEKKRPANMLIVEQKLQEINTSISSVRAFASANTTTQRRRVGPFVRGMIFLGLLCMVIGGVIGSGIGNSTASVAFQARMQAQATAYAIDQAHAAATASVQTNKLKQQIATQPYPYGLKGTLALVDPLNQPNAWQDDGSQCQFIGGVLQIEVNDSGILDMCNENTIFRNFIFQVDMTITEGTCGGLTLRGGTTMEQGMYVFFVCTDGTYSIMNYTPDSGGVKPELVFSEDANAIKRGAQENTIAAVVNGDTFTLYANGKKITSFTDNTFYAGTIGMLAEDNNSSTVVNYQNAVIWTLPV